MPISVTSLVHLTLVASIITVPAWAEPHPCVGVHSTAGCVFSGRWTAWVASHGLQFYLVESLGSLSTLELVYHYNLQDNASLGWEMGVITVATAIFVVVHVASPQGAVSRHTPVAPSSNPTCTTTCKFIKHYILKLTDSNFSATSSTSPGVAWLHDAGDGARQADVEDAPGRTQTRLHAAGHAWPQDDDVAPAVRGQSSAANLRSSSQLGAPSAGCFEKVSQCFYVAVQYSDSCCCS